MGMGMRVHQVGVERSSQLSKRTAYARGIYEDIAVRAGELSLCMGRICVVSAGAGHALALLAIGALGESVSMSDKAKPGEVMPHRNRRTTLNH